MIIQQIFFWLLIFLMPTQIGRHFWPKWTNVLGLPIDYLSPTIYLTDILLLLILISWFWMEKKKLNFEKLSLAVKKYWWIVSIFVFLFINSLLAQNSGAAIYKFIKIIEFSCFGFYVAKNEYKISSIFFLISLTIIYSSIIAIYQFINQQTLGGFFWWLGERTFNLMTPGIAKTDIGGKLLMRPYATFPHPNVLAGFILVSLILIERWRGYALINLLKIIVLVLGSITIIISFSRSTWLTALIIYFIRTIKCNGKRKILPFISKQGFIRLILWVLMIGMIAFFSSRNLFKEEAFVQRVALTRIALKMFWENPLKGVGLNNFISHLPNYWWQFGAIYWLQPVHNIYLLILAETGVTGLAIFLWFLVLTFRRSLKKNFFFQNKNLSQNYSSLIFSFLVILFLGFFDHYWLTLQQPQLLFVFILGLLWRK